MKSLPRTLAVALAACLGVLALAQTALAQPADNTGFVPLVLHKSATVVPRSSSTATAVDRRGPHQVATAPTAQQQPVTKVQEAMPAATPAASDGGLSALAIVFIGIGGVLSLLLAGYIGTRIERARPQTGALTG